MTYNRYFASRFYVSMIILLMTSAYFSWQEAKYAIWGRTADASIISVHKTVAHERHRSREVYSVRYRWIADDGMKREDKMNRELDWQQPVNGIIRIDYLPKIMGSRAQGERKIWALLLFGASLAAVALWTIKICWDAYGPRRRPPSGKPFL